MSADTTKAAVEAVFDSYRRDLQGQLASADTYPERYATRVALITLNQLEKRVDSRVTASP